MSCADYPMFKPYAVFKQPSGYYWSVRDGQGKIRGTFVRKSEAEDFRRLLKREEKQAS